MLWRTPEATRHAGHLRRRVEEPAERCSSRPGRRRSAPAILSPISPLRRGLDARAEDRHERDERDADHQRGRGRRRARRVAHRVAPGEAAGDAADPLAGTAEHGRQRTSEPVRQHRDADEQQQAARRHRRAADRRLDPAAEQRVAEDQQREAGDAERRDRDLARALAGGSSEPSCRIATGATRVARSAGTSPESIVTTTPTMPAIDDRVRGEHRRRARQVEPERRQQRQQARRRARSPPRCRPPRRRARRTALSVTTEPSTWRRDAPIVRSVASSRARWATVIDSVL